jgi:hypothetical protein
MPGNVNFTKVVLDEDELKVTGITPVIGDVVCVHVTMVINGSYVMNEFDHKAKNKEWTIPFKQPTSKENAVAVDDEVFLIGSVLREKDPKATCDCPPPDHVVWSEYVEVTAA